mmetsp:Transcript_27616/g.85293  ORF Transcript_27616/g.85293 Transcript_27616/m.85293 type:complete len:402 (+) Transcript_27616:830-2035(+)
MVVIRRAGLKRMSVDHGPSSFRLGMRHMVESKEDAGERYRRFVRRVDREVVVDRAARQLDDGAFVDRRDDVARRSVAARQLDDVARGGRVAHRRQLRELGDCRLGLAGRRVAPHGDVDVGVESRVVERDGRVDRSGEARAKRRNWRIRMRLRRVAVQPVAAYPAEEVRRVERDARPLLEEHSRTHRRRTGRRRGPERQLVREAVLAHGREASRPAADDHASELDVVDEAGAGGRREEEDRLHLAKIDSQDPDRDNDYSCIVPAPRPREGADERLDQHDERLEALVRVGAVSPARGGAAAARVCFLRFARQTFLSRLAILADARRRPRSVHTGFRTTLRRRSSRPRRGVPRGYSEGESRPPARRTSRGDHRSDSPSAAPTDSRCRRGLDAPNRRRGRESRCA